MQIYLRFPFNSQEPLPGMYSFTQDGNHLSLFCHLSGKVFLLLDLSLKGTDLKLFLLPKYCPVGYSPQQVPLGFINACLQITFFFTTSWVILAPMDLTLRNLTSLPSPAHCSQYCDCNQSCICVSIT